MGSVSWWYNHGPSDLVIAFLGETSKAWFPGEITYFLLAGVRSDLGAFTDDFIGQTFHMDDKKAKKISTVSQKGIFIIQLDEEKAKTFPVYSSDLAGNWTRSMKIAAPDVAVEYGGECTVMTGVKFPFLEEIGLSGAVLSLENGVFLAPRYTADGTTQVFYVVRGSGRVEIVGLNGKLVVDQEIYSGQLFVVPKFFTVGMAAGVEGMECFSIITSPRPLIGELGGEDSMLNINPTVLQMSLNLSLETTKQFKEKMEASEIICPHEN